MKLTEAQEDFLIRFLVRDYCATHAVLARNSLGYVSYTTDSNTIEALKKKGVLVQRNRIGLEISDNLKDVLSQRLEKKVMERVARYQWIEAVEDYYRKAAKRVEQQLNIAFPSIIKYVMVMEEWDELLDYCEETTINGVPALYIYDPDLYDVIECVPGRIYDMYDELAKDDNNDYYFVIGEVDEWDEE